MAVALEGLGIRELEIRAGQLESTGNFDGVVPVLRRLIDLVPKSTDYQWRLGRALLNLNRPVEAEKMLRQAASIPGKERWAAFAGQGIALVMLESFAEAIPPLRKALKNGVDDIAVKRGLITALDAQGLYPEALELTEELLRLHAGDVRLLLQNGKLLSRVGRWSDSAEVQKRALSLDPNPSVEMVTELAQTLAIAERWPEAIKILHRLLCSVFDLPEMHKLLSDWLDRAFPDDRGQAFLQNLIDHDPNDIAAVLQLSTLYEKTDQLDLASAMIDRCMAINPDAGIVHGRAGRLAIRRGKYRDAIIALRKEWDAAAEVVRQTPNAQPREGEKPSEGALNPIVYLAVEITGRELQTRLLIARFLADLGFAVVILGHNVFKASILSLPRGLIVYKSLNALDLELVARAKSAGHLFTVIDEEAFGYTGENFAVMRTLDIRAIPDCEAIFAPGRDYARHVAEHVPAAESRLFVTGNPRTDFYDPRLRSLFSAEADAIHAELGPSILICTNFGGWNCASLEYEAVCRVTLRLTGIDLNSERGQALFEMQRELADAECLGTAAVRDAIAKLPLAFPNHKIVVRPHPVESLAAWHQFIDRQPNVVLAPSGSLAAQMMAADALVHLPGCGTGIEGLLLGVPTISLDPVSDLKQPKYGLSAHTSPAAHDASALIEMLGRAIQDRAGFIAASARHTDLFDACIFQSAELSSQLVAKGLAKIFERKSSGERRDAGKRLPLQQLKETLDVAQKRSDADLRSRQILFSAKRLRADVSQIRDQLSVIGAQVGLNSSVTVVSPADGIFIIHA